MDLRSSWERKHELAKAKLHYKITETTVPEDYPQILLQDDGSHTDGGDFIEVHIYKGFSKGAIKSISFQNIKHKEDKVIIRSLLKKIKNTEIEITLADEKKQKAA